VFRDVFGHHHLSHGKDGNRRQTVLSIRGEMPSGRTALRSALIQAPYLYQIATPPWCEHVPLCVAEYE
jgi:hypothetical protein